MFAWFTADSGTFDYQAQFAVTSEFSGFVIRNQVKISGSLSTPLKEFRSVVCVFSLLHVVQAASVMDELLMWFCVLLFFPSNAIWLSARR